MAIQLENAAWLCNNYARSIYITFHNIFLFNSIPLLISWHELDIHHICQWYKKRTVFYIQSHRQKRSSSIEQNAHKNFKTILLDYTFPFACERVKWWLNRQFEYMFYVCFIFDFRLFAEFTSMMEFFILYLFLWTVVTMCIPLLVLHSQLVEYPLFLSKFRYLIFFSLLRWTTISIWRKC